MKTTTLTRLADKIDCKIVNFQHVVYSHTLPVNHEIPHIYFNCLPIPIR